MAASLVNLLGYTTGAILYAMLFWMVLRSSSDRLSLLTGGLGMVWNIGAFSSYGLYTVGLIGPSPILLAVSFSALGFLPAVVVHSVLRSRGMSERPAGRSILLTAYALSAVATILHLATAIRDHTSPSQLALQILTGGFVLVIAGLLLRTRKEAGWGQSLWVVSLAVFGVSALHLSNHNGTDTWWLALIGHHSSLPLALAFLHQDYRFALADIFLKRAVALVLLVSVVFGFYLAGPTPSADQRSILILMAMWVATALVYPGIRATASWFVDTVVLHRADYDMLLAEASRTISRLDSIEAILEEICTLLRSALSARSIQWTKVDGTDSQLSNIVTVTAGRNAVAIVPTVESPQYVLSISDLEGGRRFLSADTEVIEKLALLTARRIDAVRTAQERLDRNIREQEISRLAAEAELSMLRAQIHPHFLFNALTTIGYLIQTSPQRALRTLMRLSSLLRTVLRSGREISSLGEELNVISAYLDIERARFEDRLVVEIEVSSELRDMNVPSLLLQPLVENAIKHGISQSTEGGRVRIVATRTSLNHNSALQVVIEDTGCGATERQFSIGRAHGFGLNSVEKRLHFYTQGQGVMNIRSNPGVGTRVEVLLPIDAPPSIGDGEALLARGSGQ